jgi:hypothetical protein
MDTFKAFVYVQAEQLVGQAKQVLSVGVVVKPELQLEQAARFVLSRTQLAHCW